MTNRSLLFSKHLDSAPFKDFNVEVEVIGQGLQNEKLWLNRNELFPIENYKIEKIETIKNKIKGIYGVFSVIDYNTVELQNNSTKPIVIGTIKGHELKRHNIVEIEQDVTTKEITVLRTLKGSEVDNRSILKTSTNFVGFRDELIYYLLLTPKHYQEVMTTILENVWESFKYTPGSVAGHHISLGGLLEHTVEDIRVAKGIIDLNDYEQDVLLSNIYSIATSVHWQELRKKRNGEPIETALNYMVTDFHSVANTYLSLKGEILLEDIILSFLLHDLGKIVETTYLNDSKDKYTALGMGNVVNEQLDYTTFVEPDAVGNQFGHVVLSMLMFNNLNKSKSLDLVLINRIIATHHGYIPYGSIKQAESKFEYLIHISDKIDALFCGVNKRSDIKYE